MPLMRGRELKPIIMHKPAIIQCLMPLMRGRELKLVQSLKSKNLVMMPLMRGRELKLVSCFYTSDALKDAPHAGA